MDRNGLILHDIPHEEEQAGIHAIKEKSSRIYQVYEDVVTACKPIKVYHSL